MCHAWITHWTVTRAPPTIPKRRSMSNERTHGRNAREPFLARTRDRLAPRGPFLNRGARDKSPNRRTERANRRNEHGERPT